MKIKNFMMTNSYDEKIMNWNRQDFTELVNQMAEDDMGLRVDKQVKCKKRYRF